MTSTTSDHERPAGAGPIAPGLFAAAEARTAWRKGTGAVDDATLRRVEKYWRAANYLSVGQIYLLDNPLLRRPLSRDDVKPRLLGHWGTTPGLTFLYAHLNRAIAEREQSTIYVTGPGHGGPGLVASAYLDGTYSEVYSDITEDEEGLRRLFRQFSFPGGIPSHVAPETPGSIHEGGELGYALSHAYGAAFDNPHLLVAAVVGDGEAETGPLATSWHSNKFVNPQQDGIVLPILHLNGYKIANPTILARIPEDELADLMRGYGHTPYMFEAGYDEDEDELSIHRRFAVLLDEVLDEIADIKARAATGDLTRPMYPMIVFRTPKGWTGPAQIDGKKTTGSWRAHQVPLANARDTPEHLAVLEDWLQSYRPDELFDATGRLDEEISALAPPGDLRMSANPHANGGQLLRDLRLPDFRDFAQDVPAPGATFAEAPRVLGEFLTEVIRRNPDNFRIFGPDETASNRLQAVYEVTAKQWNAEFEGPEVDDHLERAGRVMEMLSEHQCQGWLEGYLLTGRHGLFTSYEAFIHIVDSMFNQHAKWLKVTNDIPWRRPIASLNYLLSSHVWRQDHNGFSHQDPGFIDHVVNKKAEVVRVYLPPDANTLLSTYDHCLRSRQYVNVVVSGKQPAPNFLTMEQAVAHCTRGLGIWEWAGSEAKDEEPDVVLACAGDVPTLEVLAAADILRRELPQLKVRVVNVVDLMRLQDAREHPHGLSDREFDTIFTADRPIVFAYHGYPWLIHRLTYRRNGHANLHVRGYKEEGTTTTPFDMVMLNDLDRYHLVIDVIDHVHWLRASHAGLRQRMVDARIRARQYTREHGEDIPDVRDWVWPDVGETATEEGGPQPTRTPAAADTGGDNESPARPRSRPDPPARARPTDQEPPPGPGEVSSTVARTIYVMSAEGDTGKSVVALGLVDLLTRTVQRVGVFRPVARSTDERDYVLELLLEHDGVDIAYEDAVGATYDEVIDDPEAALSRIVSRFHDVERRCDAVVVVGTDYTDVAGPTELAYNARIAANLAAPVVLVVNGARRSTEDVHHAVDVASTEIVANHAQVVSVIANRCDPSALDEVRAALAGEVPVWALPDSPLLYAPTLRQLMHAVGGTLTGGDEELLGREVLDVLVGAMSIEHLLDRLQDGAVVITPGDRAEVLLGLLMAHQAEGFPSLAGLILNGGLAPAPSIERLIAGLGSRLPLITTSLGTFRTASAAAATRGRLTHDAQRKVDVALALFEQHVDGAELLAMLAVPRPGVVTPLMFEYALLDRARAHRKHVVLPEGNDDRILRAASTLLQRQVADLTILGEEPAIRARATELGLDLDGAQVIDPKNGETLERFAEIYTELRRHKGMTVERAREIVSSVSYFGTLMVQLGMADGMVSGALHTTAHTIKPSFEIIKTTPGVGSVSSCFLMCLDDRVLVYADCAVIPDPTAEQLADIAISSAETAVQFGIDPLIAMLSYSTGESGSGADVEKVREATRLVRERRPDLSVEGPIQYDAAVDASVAKTKMPDSAVAGRATVFVFPDLNTGNNTYKAVQRSAGAVAIGPVLQGLRKPVNDLSRGALVQDIVNTVAITAIQAQALDAAAAGPAGTVTTPEASAR